MLKSLVLGIAALSLAACGATGGGGVASAGATPVTTQDTVFAVASTGAAVADALGVAPPATLTKTTIDEKAVRLAFKTFVKALDVIDMFIADGKLPKGSPKALAVQSGIKTVQRWLNAASAAQRAGNAATYTEALSQAQTALGSLQSTLAR